MTVMEIWIYYRVRLKPFSYGYLRARAIYFRMMERGTSKDVTGLVAARTEDGGDDNGCTVAGL